MLTGRELGAALGRAMDAKGVTQSTVAGEFGIKQPSVSEWVKYGRIGKRHLTHLVEYFADVVGPEHWGLPTRWTSEAPSSPLGTAQATATYHDAAPPRPASNRVQAGPTLSPSPPPIPNRNFADRREVSETDWSVLQAVKLVLPESELDRIKTEAERIRRTAAEQIDAAKGG